MVCIPCIVVPFLLWFFHKYIQPYVQKTWPWSKQEKVEDKKTDDPKSHCNGVSNGSVPNGHVISAGDGGGGGPPDKKND